MPRLILSPVKQNKPQPTNKKSGQNQPLPTNNDERTGTSCALSSSSIKDNMNSTTPDGKQPRLVGIAADPLHNQHAARGNDKHGIENTTNGDNHSAAQNNVAVTTNDGRCPRPGIVLRFQGCESDSSSSPEREIQSHAAATSSPSPPATTTTTARPCNRQHRNNTTFLNVNSDNTLLDDGNQPKRMAMSTETAAAAAANTSASQSGGESTGEQLMPNRNTNSALNGSTLTQASNNVGSNKSTSAVSRYDEDDDEEAFISKPSSWKNQKVAEVRVESHDSNYKSTVGDGCTTKKSSLQRSEADNANQYISRDAVEEDAKPAAVIISKPSLSQKQKDGDEHMDSHGNNDNSSMGDACTKKKASLHRSEADNTNQYIPPHAMAKTLKHPPTTATIKPNNCNPNPNDSRIHDELTGRAVKQSNKNEAWMPFEAASAAASAESSHDEDDAKPAAVITKQSSQSRQKNRCEDEADENEIDNCTNNNPELDNEESEADIMARVIEESLKQKEIDDQRRREFHNITLESRCSRNTVIEISGDDEVDMNFEQDDDIEKAIELSLKEENMRSIQLETADSASHDDGGYTGGKSSPLDYAQFYKAVHAFINKNGGWDKIEKGPLVKLGNNEINGKSGAIDGGGNQWRAQYGRVTLEGFKRIYDKLEGRDSEDDEDKRVQQTNEDYDEIQGGGDSKKRAMLTKQKDGKKQSQQETDKEYIDLSDPEPQKIKAFVDVGHGIGIQVLQAALCLGVPSRGVELMWNRNFIATELEIDLKNEFSANDFSRIDLEWCDFTHAFVPNKKISKSECALKTTGSSRFHHYDSSNRNESLRKFLLCKDLTHDEQRHLVVFANNFGDVFGDRSTKGDAPPLDQHLAELFANMEVGGRIVTLHDLSPYYEGRNDWYRRDVFESGEDTVSWSLHKSMKVFCLTKIKDEWQCDLRTCGYLHNPVVDEDNKINSACFCGNTKCNTRKPQHKRKRA